MKVKDTKELIPPVFLNRHCISDAHEHITLVYFATAKSQEITQGQNEVSEECYWFTEQELNESKYDIRASIKFYAKSALATVKRLYR